MVPFAPTGVLVRRLEKRRGLAASPGTPADHHLRTLGELRERRRGCFVRQVQSFELKHTVLLILDSEPVLEEEL